MGGEQDKEKIIPRIMEAEKVRKSFQSLLRTMKNEMTGAHTCILVPSGAGYSREQTLHPISVKDIKEWDHIFEPQEMNEEVLLKRNQRHFSKADRTPFAFEPLRSLFRELGTNQVTNEVLDGRTIDLDKLSVFYTKSILRQLKRKAQISSISSHIYVKDLKSGYKAWKEEHTSTSPSGLHFGQEKEILKEPPKRAPKDDESIQLSLANQFVNVKATMINLAMEHGHIYDLWAKVVTTMLEKITGKPHLHKLHVSHFIESYFNLMIGILWGRRLREKDELLDNFRQEQGGSRSDSSTQEVLIFKHALSSTIRMTKTDALSFDNDASSCFDHIVMNLTSMCPMHWGMDPKVCELFLKVLLRTRYHVKTRSGMSEGAYGSNET